MSFRFKLDEPLAKGVSRIGLEQLARAEAALGNEKDTARGIHDARRCLKRLRALLRLVRPALAKRAYAKEMRRLRDVARLLSDARDAHVMRQTMNKLADRFGAFPKDIAGLPTREGAASGKAATDVRRRATARLRGARAFFLAIENEPISFLHLASGMQRTYRKARRTYREAYDLAGDEAFHEWRKSVQVHWRHMQLLSRAWPDVLAARASEAKELSRLLGDDHDLAVLAATSARTEDSASGEARVELVRLCRLCQDEIRAQAKPRGARLLAQKPKALASSLELYWSSAMQLAVLPETNASEKGEVIPPRRRVGAAAPKRRSRRRPAPPRQAAADGAQADNPPPPAPA
jgi:hypothetical protein